MAPLQTHSEHCDGGVPFQLARTRKTLVVVLLCVQATLLSWIAVWNSPVCDEVGHLTAGIYAWKMGRFHLYRVNPPLVKCVAAIPAILCKPTLDWRSVADATSGRPEFGVGQDFIKANGTAAFDYYVAGRLICIPFVLLGSWVCYGWATQLYGKDAGIAALVLWCFCPTVLAWGSTFTPDAACASFVALAAWKFSNWLAAPDWRSTVVAGIVLGIAQLTKMTAIVLIPLWIVVWLGHRVSRHNEKYAAVPKPPVEQIVGIVVIAVYVLNAGYGFEGSFTRLGDYLFVSRTLAGDDAVTAGGVGGNRFADSILSSVPVPLPVNYVRGADLQKVDFENGMSSYMLGVWSDRGWWYYYLFAALVKMPAATLALLAIVVAVSIRRQQFDVMICLPPLAIFILVSSQDGFSRYFRYVLPCLPFLYIWISQVFSKETPRLWRRVGYGLAAASVASSLSVYPYSISYFNRICGGPEYGHKYLLDANIDWGQDLFRVKAWYQSHPTARPLSVVHMGFVSAYDIGMRFDWPVRSSDKVLSAPGDNQHSAPGPIAPLSGWYVMSIHELWGETDEYAWLRELKPVERIGYSMVVYNVTDSDVRRLAPKYDWR
jgi:4-amino-4-deoxy-L-arabinose transferase-like glycosyltransferase